MRVNLHTSAALILCCKQGDIKNNYILIKVAHAPFQDRLFTLISSIWPGTPETLRRMTNDTNANIAEILTCENEIWPLCSPNHKFNGPQDNCVIILTITDDNEWPISLNIVPIERATNIYKTTLPQ
jgi:hypothetical protein